MAEEVTLPDRTQAVINDIMNAQVEMRTNILTVPFNFTSSILVANTIDGVKDGQHVSCLVVNLEKAETLIIPGTQIANYELVLNDTPAKSEAVDAVVQLEATHEFIKVGDELTPEQVQEVSQLCNNFRQAFCING